MSEEKLLDEHKLINIVELIQLGLNEEYGMYYACPRCNEGNVFETHRFCPNCGFEVRKLSVSEGSV